jgi:hypothetical protein
LIHPLNLITIVTPTVERTDPSGVDFGWVMQTTFVLTIVVGAPIVGILALGQDLPTWGSRVAFAVRIGAIVWIATALAVYGYARHQQDVGDSDGTEDTD